jgi:hypothetical protein|tara:strand:+ start:6443 stop:6739 length:297 start_codon:yes stop_codon:yes gene_type:complete
MYGKKNPHAHPANSEGKPLYKPMKSTRKGKKGMVYVMKDGKKRLIHFGDSSMTDKKKGASKAQQKSYLARSAGIKNKEGKLTKNDKNSANYWSRKVNW